MTLGLRGLPPLAALMSTARSAAPQTRARPTASGHLRPAIRKALGGDWDGTPVVAAPASGVAARPGPDPLS